jgi:hypothetical protein
MLRFRRRSTACAVFISLGTAALILNRMPSPGQRRYMAERKRALQAGAGKRALQAGARKRAP